MSKCKYKKSSMGSLEGGRKSQKGKSGRRTVQKRPPPPRAVPNSVRLHSLFCPPVEGNDKSTDWSNQQS